MRSSFWDTRWQSIHSTVLSSNLRRLFHGDVINWTISPWLLHFFFPFFFFLLITRCWLSWLICIRGEWARLFRIKSRTSRAILELAVALFPLSSEGTKNNALAGLTSAEPKIGLPISRFVFYVFALLLNAFMLPLFSRLPHPRLILRVCIIGLPLLRHTHTHTHSPVTLS